MWMCRATRARSGRPAATPQNLSESKAFRRAGVGGPTRLYHMGGVCYIPRLAPVAA